MMKILEKKTNDTTVKKRQSAFQHEKTGGGLNVFLSASFTPM